MRDREFIEYLQQHPGVTPENVADHWNVSVRTVRAYVRRANDAMATFAEVVLSRGNGYAVSVTDAERFGRWMDAMRASNGADLPQTPSDRVRYLLNDLLTRNGWITLDDLAEILFVSRSALSKDLKAVEGALEAFGLSLEKRPHYGVRVVGSEMSRRLCLANLIMDGEDGQPVDAAASDVSAVFDEALASERESGSHQEILGIIAACVERVSREAKFQINAMAYQNLLVHIAIALIRIQKGCYVSLESGGGLARVRGSHEYELAERMADALGGATGIRLPQEEIAYIAMHLSGKQVLDSATENKDGVVISQDIWNDVSTMLERVWSAFRFDFRGDLELRMNLARHIVPLAARLTYHLNLKNPLLSDIKTRYSLAWSMAQEASAVLAERYGALISDDEIGYIALAFALALERQGDDSAKKRVLLVCATGSGSARLLEYRILQEFGDQIASVCTCNVMGVASMDFAEIDYVFTTVPISEALPVPVCEIKYVLDDRDVRAVKELFARPALAANSLLDRFDRELFFPHLRFQTKREVLDFLICRVRGLRDVDANFRELVWAREDVMATSFGNNVAMPHPFEAASSETFVAVALLDEPVVWDEWGRTVQVVMLSVFAREQGAEFRAFFGRLADLLMSETAVAELVGHQDWDTLERLLGARDDAD